MLKLFLAACAAIFLAGCAAGERIKICLQIGGGLSAEGSDAGGRTPPPGNAILPRRTPGS